MGRPCDHKGAYEQPAPLQLKACLQMPQVLDSSPSPHHFVRIYNQPLLLHRHLQPRLTAKCVCSASFGHHCCLPWTLATEPGGAAEDPQTTPPCSAALAKHHTVVAVEPGGLSQRHYVLLETELPHSPALDTPHQYTQGHRTI